MKCKLLSTCFLFSIFFLATNAYAEEQKRSLDDLRSPKIEASEAEEVHIDRRVRTNPYASTPSYAQGGNTSRYSTSQGWSRGNGYWWSGRRSDIGSSGYTSPSAGRR